MDPSDAFSASLFKWDIPSRGGAMPVPLLPQPHPPPPQAQVTAGADSPYNNVRRSSWQQPGGVVGLGGFEELFESYGIRYYTAEKIFEMGFTMNTLLHMKDEELDDMMNRLSRIFRWDLLVGERYGVKAAVRAERYRLEEEESRRLHHLHHLHVDTGNTLDALSQEGLSDEAMMQQEKEALGSGGITGEGRTWELAETMHRRKKKGRGKMGSMEEADESEGGGGGGDDDENVSGRRERQREHPFIVTEPGEVARGKKNGLDYLFHLFEQCNQFLIQVQTIAKEKGEKSPTKVTNQVFRYAKKAGASYINKPKMRHYVHCYALHCLDEETSNALRRAFKERRENVGAWRQACYKPLVAIAAQQGWDIDAIFSTNPRLSIWYVPTKLRQLCHAERSNTAASSSVIRGADYLPF